MELRLLRANKTRLIQMAPTKPNHLVPYLSATCPHKTPKTAEERDATVYANDVWPLDHPNSKETGFKKTEIEAIEPKAKPLNTKTTSTITQP